MSTVKPSPSKYAWNLATQTSCKLYAPPKCKDGCYDCGEQYRTEEQQAVDSRVYTEALSDAEAIEVLASHANSIRDDLDHLRQSTTRYGDTIMTRWRKRTIDKRAMALARALPGIYPDKWPLIRTTYNAKTWHDVRKYRAAYLLPYITVEDLKGDVLKLFSLLHNRTQYGPEEWVSFDRVQTKHGWDSGLLAAEFASCCVVMYGANYGSIVPWEAKRAHRWEIVGFPRARLIMEAQSTLLAFLRKLVDDILTGVVQESSNEKWLGLAATGFQALGQETWHAYSNQAFASPRMDFDHLFELAKSRLSHAEDHLWLLQTDPEYLRIYAKSATQGRVASEKAGSHMYSAFSMQVWHAPVSNVHSWSCLVDEISHVRAHYLASKDRIHLGEALPDKFDFALGALEVLVVNQLINRSQALGRLLPFLVSFQDYFAFNTSLNDRIITNLKTKNTNAGELYSRDPLFWCLLQLTVDPEKTNVFNPAMLFAFIDDWRSKPSTKMHDANRICPVLLDVLSDLAATHELLVAVRTHRPVCTVNHVTQATKEGADRMAWRYLRVSYGPIDRGVLGTINKLFQKIQSEPFPSGKRNIDWLARADRVRDTCRDFWNQARKAVLASLKNDYCIVDEGLLRFKHLMSADSAPEHLSFLQAERDSILLSAPPAKSGQTHIPIPNVPGEESSCNVGLNSTRLTLKVKTRDLQQGANCDRDNRGETSLVKVEDLPRIQVSSRSKDVFSSMFPRSANELKTKPLEWTTFVKAMTEAGFVAEHAGGSAVAFVKANEGRIVFHKPHPVAKIEQVILRSWGKRMQKWFGWNLEKFVEDKKQPLTIDADHTHLT